MSKIVLDAIAADTATLTRLVPSPLEPFGYGTDLSCVEDVTEDLAEVDPFTVRAIGEALARRLTTPRGSLPDDPDYGLDVRGYCNRGVPITELQDLSGQIRGEVTKDDRVEDAAVTVTIPARNQLHISVTVTPVDPSLGPFSLTFAVVNGQLTLESLA